MTKFLNLKNLKHILRGTPLPLKHCAEMLEKTMGSFNETTGIPDDIIRWNIQFKYCPELHPLENCCQHDNSPTTIEFVEKEDLIKKEPDRYPEKVKERSVKANEDCKKWAYKSFATGETIGGKGIVFHVEHIKHSEWADKSKQFPSSCQITERNEPKKDGSIITCSIYRDKEEDNQSARNYSVSFDTKISLDGGKESVPMRFEAPLRIILRGCKDLDGTYTVYLHSLLNNTDEEFVYYGLTKRRWDVRFLEHWRERNHKTRRLFPLKIKTLASANLAQQKGELNIQPKLDMIWSTICASGLKQNGAMDVEEYLVDKYSLNSKHPNGLNMIPGGYAGMKALHKLRAISDSQKNQFMSTERREELLDKYLLQNPRVGGRNPGVEEKWNDSAYAEAVICGREDRLDPGQVREIRYLSASGFEPDVIMGRAGARNIQQVEGVLSGKHYSRIN